MEASIIIAIVSLLGVLLNSLFVYKSNKDKTSADISRTNADTTSVEVSTAREIIEELKQTVEEHREQIKMLQIEIKQLQLQEHIHLQEKIRLEEKIYALTEENKSLRNLMGKNELIYINQIDTMKLQIKKLKIDLEKYSNAIK